MSHETTVHTDQEALQALQPTARSVEDLDQLGAWQEEIDDRRSSAGKLLSSQAVPHFIEVQGVVEDAQRITVARHSGQEVSVNTYGTHGRHA